MIPKYTIEYVKKSHFLGEKMVLTITYKIELSYKKIIRHIYKHKSEALRSCNYIEHSCNEVLHEFDSY